MKKRLMCLISIITMLCMTACGSSYSAKSMDNGAYYDDVATADYAYADTPAMGMASTTAAEEGIAYDSMEGGAEAAVPQAETVTENEAKSGRKLIKNVSLDVETTDYDSLIAALPEEVENLGGYVENMNVYNGSSYDEYRHRSANITARIPSQKLNDFINSVGTKTNITNRNEYVEDITLTYVDLESHKNMLIAERDRLTELLSQAETVEDIITIEDRLTGIRYQIDSMESQLRTYDNKVDYSTVNISVSEVVVYTPTETVEYTVWERISNGFGESLEDVGTGLVNFFVAFITHLPQLVVFAIVVTVIILVIRAILNRDPERKERVTARKKARKERKAAKKAAKKAKKDVTNEAAPDAVSDEKPISD